MYICESKKNIMGLTYTEIELVSQYDEYKFEDGLITAAEIKSWFGTMMVDTGAIRLVINETIKKQLGLKNGLKMNVTLANGEMDQLELVGGIKIKFKERYFYSDAFVLPNDTEPLLGVIPLEGMDLVVIPSENKLAYNPAHPDGALFALK
jgi:clan AA aspartic protease